MKIFLNIIVLVVFIDMKATAFKKIAYRDTLYISVKNDLAPITVGTTSLRNEVIRSTISPMYLIYGFMRGNKPKDFLDSLGYHSFAIFLEKDTLSICKSRYCKSKMANKTITLYDLKDSLKAHINLHVAKKNRPQYYSKRTPGSYLSNDNIVLILVEQDKKCYYLRKVKDIDYFRMHRDY